MIGRLTYHGFNPNLAIIRDAAGQYKVFLHGLCWIHAERSIQKIIGFSDYQNQLLEEIKSDIWKLYNDLKNYRLQPDEIQQNDLEGRFDNLFTRKTRFATLDQALKRIYRNKSELLLVLQRPDIPLHNNLSERDIREYVKRRKISGSTRSEMGKECRDTLLVHQRNHIRADFAFTQKHFQYYVPKSFLQHAGINGRGNGKHTVFMETSVGNENMQVRIKAQKITLPQRQCPWMRIEHQQVGTARTSFQYNLHKRPG